MSYYGVQGQYTRHPRYVHADGTHPHDVPDDTPAYHDDCFLQAFGIEKVGDDWGSAHGPLGFTWAPWLNGKPCCYCGKPS